MLTFWKFWSATHYQRKDIPRSYLVAIRACLKARGGVFDDSLADDIPLGSDSQGPVSFLIFALN